MRFASSRTQDGYFQYLSGDTSHVVFSSATLVGNTSPLDDEIALAGSEDLEGMLQKTVIQDKRVLKVSRLKVIQAWTIPVLSRKVQSRHASVCGGPQVTRCTSTTTVSSPPLDTM